MKKQKFKWQNGYIMLLALILLGIFLTLSAALLGYTTLNLKGSRVSVSNAQSIYLAEAGLAKALTELNIDSNFSGLTDVALGSGSYSVEVLNINANQKKITSTGFVPNSLEPKSQKTISAMASIDTSSVSFNYGVQVGAGGLEMSNNSQVFGNVFSNGSITGDSGTDITGDVIVASGSSPLSDQEWTVQNADFQFGHSSSYRDVAQSFKPSATNPLNKINVYLRKVGSPGNITVRIMSNSGGSPSKTVLATATINNFLVTGSYGWVEANFSSPPTLNSGTTYWLMLSVSSSSSNYYYWGRDSAGGYTNGNAKYSSNWNAGSPVWNAITGDLNFKTFMGGVTTYFDAQTNVGGNLTATEIRDCGSVAGSAYYVSVFTSCSAGASFSGQTIPGPESMPISQSQIDEWKTNAEAGGVLSGPYQISGTQTLGPVKINGDLNFNNNSVLYITGPIWVNGNINISNDVTIQVHSSLGNNGAVLLADNPSSPSTSGIVDIQNNAILQGNGNVNSYLLVVSMSTDTDDAMRVRNNATGAIFYAPNGGVEVSNNAGGNQITGYRIELENNSNITYQSGLQNATFSNGPGGSWALMPGSYRIEP